MSLLICIKYLGLVLRADNRGEGGALALMSLAQPGFKSPLFGLRKYIGFIGMFGAALLYGDSIITPSISVLSAIEGLGIATPVFEKYIIPITILILVGLFSIQSRGTAKVGALFGPITLVWFLTLAALGIRCIFFHPEILSAVNPIYAVNFFIQNRFEAFFALGAVFLCVTGGEALYADMGHFGIKPIRYAWFFIAYPALVLNYFGQGALLLSDPSTIENPFYLMAPDFLLYPLVGLATLATISASQAVISGAFSVTSQAIKLGLLPRMPVTHTSTKEIGQIYVPRINWILCIITIWLVVQFKTSSNLASAYGIAVSSTMVITTILIYVVMRNLWGWSRILSASIAGFFFVIDFTFLAANLIKIHDGGWFPILVGITVFTLMIIWQQGRRRVRQQLAEKLPALEVFIKEIPEMTPLRVPGTAIYMSSYRDLTPPALMYNLKHNRVIHDVLVLLTIEIEEVPFVSPMKRIEVRDFGKDIFQVIVRYGFKDSLDLRRAFKLCQTQGLEVDIDHVIFFLGRERSGSSRKEGLTGIRQAIFSFMLNSSQDASKYFGIKPEQIIELGFQVEV
jgi:KUP system potassium uptake protein